MGDGIVSYFLINLFFNRGHIKNAIFFDTMECVKVTKLIPSNIPDKACFEKYVESLGISDNHQIILYDRSQYGFFIAPRAWWIFRVRFILIAFNFLI